MKQQNQMSQKFTKYPLYINNSNKNSLSNSSSPSTHPRQQNLHSNKVFVGGIPFNISSDELSNYFGQFGQIASTKLAKDRRTGKLKGYAFVTFVSAIDAERACAQHDHMLNGKSMGVKEAKSRTEAIAYSKTLQGFKIFAKGFPQETKEKDVYQLFCKFGSVERVQMQFNPKTKLFKGFCYVIMKSPASYHKLVKLKTLNFLNKHKIFIGPAASKKEVGNLPKEKKFVKKETDSEKNLLFVSAKEQNRRHSSYISLTDLARRQIEPSRFFMLSKNMENRKKEEKPKITCLVIEKNEKEEDRAEEMAALRPRDHNLLLKRANTYPQEKNLLRELEQAISYDSSQRENKYYQNNTPDNLEKEKVNCVEDVAKVYSPIFV